ncbi:hypothetical protein BDV23DRAFT_17908 [Aspergillus alliaceus]|uniref:Uncharacterized protein n=1 Tax=Petromyces alliaceus TaxID=209559 RepID=A0A5N7CJ27_PETAA|nr:hypothetical protein BDV23DRAFT_17908 [Aspergillus alliaceus]
MLAGDTMSVHTVMGPVRRGPIRDNAVGQFVNDVPSPHARTAARNCPIQLGHGRSSIRRLAWFSKRIVCGLVNICCLYFLPSSQYVRAYSNLTLHISYSVLIRWPPCLFFSHPLCPWACLESDRQMIKAHSIDLYLLLSSHFN